MSRISEIFIAESPASEMKAVQDVRAVAGRGLEGDRYYFGRGTFSPNPMRPDFEITLIEKENIEAFAQATGLPFTAADARRNVVTEGIRLNDLVGKELLLGEVAIRGIRWCEPCAHLAKSSFSEIMDGLVHKGGLRAQILVSGRIRTGDAIRVLGAE